MLTLQVEIDVVILTHLLHGDRVDLLDHALHKGELTL